MLFETCFFFLFSNVEVKKNQILRFNVLSLFFPKQSISIPCASLSWFSHPTLWFLCTTMETHYAQVDSTQFVCMCMCLGYLTIFLWIGSIQFHTRSFAIYSLQSFSAWYFDVCCLLFPSSSSSSPCIYLYRSHPFRIPFFFEFSVSLPLFSYRRISSILLPKQKHSNNNNSNKKKTPIQLSHGTITIQTNFSRIDAVQSKAPVAHSIAKASSQTPLWKIKTGKTLLHTRKARNKSLGAVVVFCEFCMVSWVCLCMFCRCCTLLQCLVIFTYCALNLNFSRMGAINESSACVLHRLNVYIWDANRKCKW